MFHFIITATYIIPNIYVFFRIKNLFIGKTYRIAFSLVYLLIACFYPLVGFFAEHSSNTFAQILSTISGYFLAFFLYLFLSVFLFDAFLLINLVFKVLPYERRKSYTCRTYTLSTMIALSIVVVIAGSINLNTIRVSEYQIKVPAKNSIIKHLRVAFVADFHIQQNTSMIFVEQYVSKVNALKPDIMLYGGDIVEGDNENETTEAIESAFKKINTKYGTYGVVGNHEFYGGQQQGSFFKNAGIKLLNDTIEMIDSLFYIAGRYDQHFAHRKSIDELLVNQKFDLPFILMDHRPTSIQQVSKTGVDLQFSGHTHNGQLFPFNLITNIIYELSWGYKKIGNTHFFVTSGIRLWGPPVKTAGKSEIMLVDICFE